MALVLGIHGIAQQYKGEEVLKAMWLPALRDGLTRAHGPRLGEDQFRCVFFGDLFRPPGKKALGMPTYDAASVQDPWEAELLDAWWNAATRAERDRAPSDSKARTPRFVQKALNGLSRSAFFGGLATSLLIGHLKQVRAYLHDGDVRRRVRSRVEEVVRPDTNVLIGHSLGSVVAYEALCARPDWTVRRLITLGSPLGIRNLVFDLLDPPPMRGKGTWPREGVAWTNIADAGDIVALQKTLAGLFDGPVQDALVDNGAKAHDVVPYLTAKETGDAIAAGLRG